MQLEEDFNAQKRSLTKNRITRATKQKVRFSQRGNWSVEDLWDFGLRALDDLYKDLNKQLKALEEDSLLYAPTSKGTLLRMKLEIVKYIVDVKLKERDKKEKELETKARKKQLLAALERKQQENLESLSADELKALLDGLE